MLESYHLLNFMINIIKDFNKTPSETTSIKSAMVKTQVPSFFLLNIVFKVKKVSINEDEQINYLNPETFNNYGKTLATSTITIY